MADRAEIGPRMEACFEEIRTSRMAGIPILNESLSVKVIGGQSWNGYWLCVLITPWFINLMAIADGTEDEPAVTGTKRMFAFPAGSFEFIAGREEAIGAFWMCSLFSPVLEFSDQEAAEATAGAALDAIFDTGAEADPSEREIAAMWRGEIPVTGENADGKDAEEDTSEEDSASGDEPYVPHPVSRRTFLRGGANAPEEHRDA